MTDRNWQMIQQAKQRMKDNENRFCPQCGADWQAEPIPEADRQHFGSHTHFSRRIAVYDLDRDITVAYRCPDCGHTTPRQWNNQ